jgi:hypothetical protein
MIKIKDKTIMEEVENMANKSEELTEVSLILESKETTLEVGVRLATKEEKERFKRNREYRKQRFGRDKNKNL